MVTMPSSMASTTPSMLACTRAPHGFFRDFADQIAAGKPVSHGHDTVGRRADVLAEGDPDQ